MFFHLLQGKVIAQGTFDQLQKMGDSFTSILRETEESYKRRHSSSQKSDTASPDKSLQRQSTSESVSRKPFLQHQHSLLDDIVPEVELKPEKGRPKTEIYDHDDLDVTRKTKSLTTLTDSKKSPETERLLGTSRDVVFQEHEKIIDGAVEETTEKVFI